MFQTPTYQKAIRIAKPLLVVVLTIFIFYKLLFTYKIHQRFEQYDLLHHHGSYLILVLAFVLLFVNWGIESIKWHKLINRFEPMPFLTATKAVLSGVTLSIITPNQIGDFVGRVIHLEVLNKLKGSLITVIGHTAQVIITLFFGVISLSYFSIHYAGIWYWIPVAIVFLIGLIFVYLRMNQTYQYVKEVKWLKGLAAYADVFSTFNSKELLQILGWSFLRYLVFLFQYYLLLHFYEVEIDVLPAIACIIGTFCVQSVVPSFLLLEIGLRGASALAFFQLFSSNQEGILLAAYSLWMVNMLLPALIGMYFIYQVRS